MVATAPRTPTPANLRSMGRGMDRSIGHSMSQSTHRSMSRSTRRSMSQSTRRSMSRSTLLPATLPTDEPTIRATLCLTEVWTAPSTARDRPTRGRPGASGPAPAAALRASAAHLHVLPVRRANAQPVLPALRRTNAVPAMPIAVAIAAMRAFARVSRKACVGPRASPARPPPTAVEDVAQRRAGAPVARSSTHAASSAKCVSPTPIAARGRVASTPRAPAFASPHQRATSPAIRAAGRPEIGACRTRSAARGRAQLESTACRAVRCPPAAASAWRATRIAIAAPARA
jgi:hypothetical protein